jgi:hypothetical protein
MNDSLFSTKDMVKYLIVAGLVYTILKMIPSVQLANKDLMLLLAIITVGFVCLDCLFVKKTEGFANEDPFTLDLNTDINELIKQRQNKKNTNQESKSVISEKIKQEDAERQAILSRLEEKSQKSTDPVKMAKEEIKKLDAQISNAFSGADAEKAKRAKAEIETKLQMLKAKENSSEEERIDAIVSSKVAEEKLSQLKARKNDAMMNGSIAEVRAISEEIGVVTKSKEVADEYVNIISKRKEAIKKKLAETPVSEEERKRIVIDDSIKLPEDDSTGLPKTSCGVEVEKIKRQMEEQLIELKEQLQARTAIPPSSAKIANRYFESLMNDLADRGILDATEIDNIQAKLRTKLLSMDEVIASLETLKKEGKSKVRVQDGKVKNDREYSELPSDFYTPIGQQVPNEWSSEYTILNTNKWQVPMPRPPVCINTTPCKVCPSDTSNNSTNLKQWDDSRYVSGGKINKKWAEDQMSA